ncbi:MAG TPA: Type 1 glutamine amidotransferase-like domain-containing protein [Bacillota bacterium]|nr:Type 1 glutamine amidotransferase-like domain-containing protein [Bacillota bacterium]
MKLLLTSAGLTNPSLVEALRNMLERPTKELKIVVIPTAHNVEFGDKSWMIQEDLVLPYQVGWQSFGVVDLAAVYNLDKSLWWPQLEEADVLLVGGGNVFYLSYWMQRCGIYDALPEWLKTKAYIGISAGSQIMGTDLYADVEAMEKDGIFTDEDYDEMGPSGQSSSRTLKLVDFTFRPHLNSKNFQKIRIPYLQEVAKTLKTDMYAVDDDAAVQVIDANISAVGGGEWHHFRPGS